MKKPHKTVFTIWRHKKKKGFSVIGHHDDHKDYSVIKRPSLTGSPLGYTSYDIELGAIRRNYTHKYVTWTVLDPAGNC